MSANPTSGDTPYRASTSAARHTYRPSFQAELPTSLVFFSFFQAPSHKEHNVWVHHLFSAIALNKISSTLTPLLLVAFPSSTTSLPSARLLPTLLASRQPRHYSGDALLHRTPALLKPTRRLVFSPMTPLITSEAFTNEEVLLHASNDVPSVSLRCFPSHDTLVQIDQQPATRCKKRRLVGSLTKTDQNRRRFFHSTRLARALINCPKSRRLIRKARSEADLNEALKAQLSDAINSRESAIAELSAALKAADNSKKAKENALTKTETEIARLLDTISCQEKIIAEAANDKVDLKAQHCAQLAVLNDELLSVQCGLSRARIDAAYADRAARVAQEALLNLEASVESRIQERVISLEARRSLTDLVAHYNTLLVDVSDIDQGTKGGSIVERFLIADVPLMHCEDLTLKVIQSLEPFNSSAALSKARDWLSEVIIERDLEVQFSSLKINSSATLSKARD